MLASASGAKEPCLSFFSYMFYGALYEI